MRNSIIFFIFCTQISYANTLKIQDYLQAVKDQYPLIKIQRDKIEKQQGNYQKSKGGFDTSLTLSSKKYAQGYYDMEQNEIAFNRKLPFAHSKIQIGRRQSAGVAPVYYSEAQTDSSGENFIRFQASLLRYREIDPQRYNLYMAKNELKIQKVQSTLKLMDILTKANTYYWKWVVAYEKLQIYKDLVTLNKDRFKAIAGRVKKKDLAKIYLTESEQYLLSFQAELADIEAKYNQSLNFISLYNNNFNFKSKPEYQIDLPISHSKNLQVHDFSWRPEIKILKYLHDLSEIAITSEAQKLKPKLDFTISHYDSQLDSDQQYGDETLIGIKLEIPIERDLGNGAIAKAKVEKNIISTQILQTRRELKAYGENLENKINGLVKAIHFKSKEVKNTKILQTAEWKKFKAGASNFFLINTRDINYAKSRIGLIEKYSQLQIAKFEREMFINPLTDF